jgi:hypothetical protein
MTAELSRLAPEIVIVAMVCLTIVIAVIAAQWAKVRRQEAALEFTRQLIEQGLPVDEVERILAQRFPPSKGLLEQFNALGRGTKAGLIFLAFMVVGVIGGVVQSYIFWAGRK